MAVTPCLSELFFLVSFKVVKYGGGPEIEEIPGPSGWCSCSCWVFFVHVFGVTHDISVQELFRIAVCL